MSRTRSVMVVCAALVAASILIVYAYRAGQSSADRAQSSSQAAEHRPETGDEPLAQNEAATPHAASPEAVVEPGSDAPKPSKEPPKPAEAAPAQPAETAAPSAGQSREVLYDLGQLPDPIKSTLESIVVAAQSGDIDEMLPVLEENELPPMLSASAVSDPIAFWKKASADGEGRDILAAIMNVFSSGFVRIGEGKDVMYVWPYFAEIDLSKLTPAQEVELYRIVPAAQALAMKQSGKYTYYRAGIGADGVWHYFLQ